MSSGYIIAISHRIFLSSNWQYLFICDFKCCQIKHLAKILSSKICCRWWGLNSGYEFYCIACVNGCPNIFGKFENRRYCILVVLPTLHRIRDIVSAFFYHRIQLLEDSLFISVANAFSLACNLFKCVSHHVYETSLLFYRCKSNCS